MAKPPQGWYDEIKQWEVIVKRLLYVGVVFLSFAACSKIEIDKEKEHLFFMECLDKAAMIAPYQTKYNDTAEAIVQCRISATRLAEEYSFAHR